LSFQARFNLSSGFHALSFDLVYVRVYSSLFFPDVRLPLFGELFRVWRFEESDYFLHFFMILSSSRFPFSNQVVGHGMRVLMVNFSAVITPPMNEESPRDFRNGME
jgi:hypothetical protein